MCVGEKQVLLEKVKGEGEECRTLEKVNTSMLETLLLTMGFPFPFHAEVRL
jgi:hypothetical protein